MSKEELANLHDSLADWLRQLPGYTGSFIQTEPSGTCLLVVMMNPVTEEAERRVREKFPGVPLRFENVPPFAVQL